ncbi:hypothetical protein CsSME_00020001 [Camellia sinensis var. sinensis]
MRIIKSLFVWLTYASIIRFNWGCLEEQRAALLQIKDSINSPVGSAFSSWYDEHCCQWEAVECDPSNSTVIKLFFYYRRDKSIPKNWYPNATSFAQLKDLQELHLEGNQIGGFTSPSEAAAMAFKWNAKQEREDPRHSDSKGFGSTNLEGLISSSGFSHPRRSHLLGEVTSSEKSLPRRGHLLGEVTSSERSPPRTRWLEKISPMCLAHGLHPTS